MHVPVAVEFGGVCVRFGSRLVLDHFSLTIHEGRTVVLLGRSGSGKTTALRLVNRLLEPDFGRVAVLGQPTDAWDVAQLRRSIGYVIQHAGLFPHMTVGRNISLPLELEKKAGSDARACELLELVGLDPEEFRHKYPDQLSGGQRQRVSVARALARNPRILLLDEPFGALDPITRLELQRQFLTLKKSLGTTAILVTHDLTEAVRLGDEIALIDQGKLAFCVPAAEFADAPGEEARRFREAFWQEK